MATDNVQHHSANVNIQCRQNHITVQQNHSGRYPWHSEIRTGDFL